MKRTALAGLAAAGLYLVSAALTVGPGGAPVRPFFDGLHTPEPYRWVTPPADAETKARPQATSADVPLRRGGNEGTGVATDDGQAQVLLPEDAIRPRANQTAVRVAITPLDPATIGAPPPGTAYQANAYEVVATYVPSGEPAEFVAGESCPEGTPTRPSNCMTIILRYANIVTALEMYRRSGQDWVPVISTNSQASFQVYAEVPTTGVYVPTGIPTEAPAPSRTGDFAAVALGVIAVGLGLWGARARKARQRRELVARARGKKMKPDARKSR